MTEYGAATETAETSEPPYERIGRQLREAREARRLSIGEAGRRVNLAGILIEDLEQGRVDRMAGIYRRGYIRNYAGMLGLDADQLLAELEPDRPPDLQEVMPASNRVFNFDRLLKVATYVVVTIAIVPPLVIFYVQSGSRMAEREASVVERPIDDDAAASANEERVAQRISQALALDEPPNAAQNDEPGHMSASALPLSAIRSVRETDPETPVPASENRDPATGSESAIAAPSGLDLQVDLRDDSWVEIVAADGERLEYDLLRSGQTRRYSGQPPFRILLGRASSVDLVVDGRVVEYSGHDRGDVIELELLANGDARL